MTPAKPASQAPRQKTIVNSFDTRMPQTRAMAGSSTPARIIAPRRVRSRSAHSATANTTAIRLMASRYVGKLRPSAEVAPRRAGGVAMRIGSPVHTMRHTSATMNERPSVTSTWASSAPGNRRKTNRSTIPPKRATPSPLRMAAVQKSTPRAIRLVARYAPSMKNEPWVRLGIRMSPKIKEKPAERRKRRPPSVMLLTASSSHRFTPGGPGSALQRRIVARVDRLREKPLLVVRPELADLRIRLDGRVDEPVPLPFAAPDIEVADDVAEVVEAERPARGIGEGHAPQRLDEVFAVVGLAARLLEGGLRHHAVDVESRGVSPRDVAVLAHHPVDELLVARGVDVVRVEVARDHADRLVPEGLQEGVVTRGRTGHHGEIEPLILVLLHELQRIRPREALDDRVGAADLHDVGRVVRRHQRRPQFLHDPPARILEDPLEAPHLLVAECEVVGEGDEALEFELLRGVVGQGVHALRGGGGGADEEGIGLALGHVFGRREAQDRHLRLGGVVADGQKLEGCQRPQDHVDVVALDELLRLGLGARGIASSVRHDQLDLPAGEDVVAVLQEADHALLHLDASRGERPRLHGQEPDLDGLLLREGGRPREGGSGRGADQEVPTREPRRHGLLLWRACAWRTCTAGGLAGDLQARGLVGHLAADGHVTNLLPEAIDLGQDLLVRLLDVDGIGDGHPAWTSRQPEHFGAVALGIQEVAADGARVVDHVLDAIALGAETPVEVAEIVECLHAHRDLLDQVRIVRAGPSAHQGDFMVDGLRIRAEEDDAETPVLLGHLHAHDVAVESDHALEVAHVDADVSESYHPRHGLSPPPRGSVVAQSILQFG